MILPSASVRNFRSMSLSIFFFSVNCKTNISCTSNMSFLSSFFSYEGKKKDPNDEIARISLSLVLFTVSCFSRCLMLLAPPLASAYQVIEDNDSSMQPQTITAADCDTHARNMDQNGKC